MTETSGYMDPGTYDAAQFARVSYAHVKDGYWYGYLNSLAVSAHTPAGMSVDVATGAAWIQGCWYTSDALNTLTIDTAHATLDRIDRIILRKTSTTDITAVVLKGTAAASPAAPALTQTTDGTWEISLAQVLVTHAVTSIAGTGTTLITDERTSAYSAFGAMTVDSSGNIAAGTKRIVSLADPSGDQDADTKAARNAAISTAVAGVVSANLYGAGADGAIHISADTGSYSGLKQCTTFLLDATKTLTLNGNLVVIATTSITISGTIVGTGQSTLAGGVGTSSAGAGAAAAGYAFFTLGSAGGTYGSDAGGAGSAAFAAYPGFGTVLSYTRRSYDILTTLITSVLQGATSGSSGGAGAVNSGTGGSGGKGGAMVILIAPTITITASTGAITTNGAAGTNGSGTGACGGGGGNGGDVVLAGKTITVSGTITQTGGAGGTSTGVGSAGTAGSDGRTIQIPL
jgi:hypothetical protein